MRGKREGVGAPVREARNWEAFLSRPLNNGPPLLYAPRARRVMETGEKCYTAVYEDAEVRSLDSRAPAAAPWARHCRQSRPAMLLRRRSVLLSRRRLRPPLPFLHPTSPLPLHYHFRQSASSALGLNNTQVRQRKRGSGPAGCVRREGRPHVSFLPAACESDRYAPSPSVSPFPLCVPRSLDSSSSWTAISASRRRPTMQ